MNLKLVSDYERTFVKPSLLQKMKGVNEFADGNLEEVHLSVEIPESIASELAKKLFNVKTQNRPVIIHLHTPRTVSLGSQLV